MTRHELRYLAGDTILKLKMLLLYRGSIRDWYSDVWLKDAGQQMCCSGYECGCMGADYGSMWEHLWRNRK